MEFSDNLQGDLGAFRQPHVQVCQVSTILIGCVAAVGSSAMHVDWPHHASLNRPSCWWAKSYSHQVSDTFSRAALSDERAWL